MYIVVIVFLDNKKDILENIASASATYDLNGDGQVNTSDMDTLIRDILDTQYGDFNLNGSVTGADYTIWANNFENVDTGWISGDANGDGTVNGADYTYWANSMGFASISSRYAPASIPEPATLTLLCTGGMLVLSRRRSRKR